MITNNEGKMISVSNEVLTELRQAYADGDWACLCKDTAGKTHCVLIEQNRIILNHKP